MTDLEFQSILDNLPSSLREEVLSPRRDTTVVDTPVSAPVTTPPIEELALPEEPTAPETNTTSDFRTRFSSADWFTIAQQSVVLAGVGGIGSWTALLLARAGAQLTIYDPDSFDATNIAGQLVPTKHIGVSKAQSVSNTCKEFSDVNNISILTRRWVPGEIVSKICICGFDNMEARKNFYHGWKEYVMSLPAEERKECLFIDGRLAAEAYQVLTIRGFDNDSMTKYERDYLFDSSEADATTCSYKQTSHMAAQIAGKMVEQYTNFCANLANPGHPIQRPIFFFIEHDAKYGATNHEL